MHPSSPLARLRALEDELRELLGASVVDEALRNACVDDSGADERDETSPRPRARSPATPTARRSAAAADADARVERGGAVSVGTTATRTVVTMDAASAVPSASASAEAEAWDPYAAFIGIGRERGPSRRDDRERSAPSSPVAPAVRGMMDASLTHDETLRLVADLEEKVKAKPVEVPPAPREAEVVVEDVLEEDQSQRFTHQHTREDAGAVLEQVKDATTGLWTDTTWEKDDAQPRARPSISAAVQGNEGTNGTRADELQDSQEVRNSRSHPEPASLARAPGIAGVETVAEFKALMNAIFEEDE